MKYWTDERVKTLTKMWHEGASAGKIADTLGGTTRNAVIGKVFRLGYSNRKVTKPATAKSAKPRSATASSGKATSKAKPKPRASAQAAAKPQPKQAKSAKPKQDRADADVKSAQDPQTKPKFDIATKPPHVPLSAMFRNNIIPAGQPLPPQPSPNEVNEEALALVAEAEKISLRISLMELTEKTCKWPVGDPATDDFWFCGLQADAGKPYCSAHAALAYQPMSARRDRRAR